MIFLCSLTWVIQANPNQSEVLEGDSYIEEEIKVRLELMDCLVKTNLEEDVLDQVKRYVLVDKASSKLILTRRELYFPLIDKLLLDNNLPTELKYITAIESAINPKVKSYAGAAGMWQFMPATAKMRGLIVNDKIDQRLDPVSSTIAAIEYLKALYGMFGDWALVLAAYNCGENKVLELIEKTGSKDFWQIRKDLPRQTQLFVPAFIGVSYLMHFYGEHDLIPSVEEMPTQTLTFARIYDDIDLKKMYRSSGLDKEVFEYYNPAFKKNDIPAEKSDGYYINLPDTLMIKFVDYYLLENNKKISSDSSAADELSRIDIISFNRPYQFLPEDIVELQAQELHYEFLKDAKITTVPQTSGDQVKNFIYHIVKSRESLSDIVDIYDGINSNDLINWNQLDQTKAIRPGTVLVIKR